MFIICSVELLYVSLFEVLFLMATQLLHKQDSLCPLEDCPPGFGPVSMALNVQSQSKFEPGSPHKKCFEHIAGLPGGDVGYLRL